ncbi:SDR family NAD(P)-dependent oxidoreductase [Rathayibacter sp. CAU 1779]
MIDDDRAGTADATAWDPLHLPSQRGTTFVVTGSTAGIGYFEAEQLARAGAQVIIAARNEQKARIAESAILSQVPDASLDFVPFDLASLASVRDAAAELAEGPRLDGVILNAGVVSAPKPGEVTDDGFPPLIGGYLGNFAFVAHLLDAADPGRIVHTSSGYVTSSVDIGDLADPPRRTMAEYARSKAAIEVFGFELDRRLRTAGRPTASLMSRPGMAVDSRTPRRPGLPRSNRWREPLWGFAGQSKESAAWSAVRAATDPVAQGGEYFGPAHGATGLPVRVRPLARFADPHDDLAARLLAQSELLTGVRLHLDRAEG